MHRLWILIGMACILGYSVNASAIELHTAAAHGDGHPLERRAETEASAETGELGVGVNTAIQAAVSFWLVIKLTRGK